VNMNYRIGVDTGGTFTDLCLVEETTGSMLVTKVPSTPIDPAEAVISGLKKILIDNNISPGMVGFLIHGTTVATNALLEGKGAPTAFITTQGFEDILLIGRQSRPKLYDFWARRPEPLVQRNQCYGAPERMLHTGEVLRPLKEEAVRQFISSIKAQGINSLAVSLIHAYANPVHEKRIKELISEIHPEALVTLSSEILSEYREYERSSTVCINAYVMPKVNAYMAHLDDMLKNLGIASELYIMQSNGGVITAETAQESSARTVLSGPAGGALAGVQLAKILDCPNVITIDIGGTSSDICLIENNQPKLTTESDIEGYPIKLPMIDINTIGAGGGSIAWIDAGGALRVGPESAGAMPGPICYGRGGTEPTVTDANAILGRISPSHLLGGDMDIKLDEALKILEEKIALPLNLSVTEAAEGIIAVVNANMIRGIRRVSVEQGHDPRDFVLVPFGGAGPLHGIELAQALNITKIIIPAYPGIASAVGMLSADVRHDYVQTAIVCCDQADPEKLEELFSTMKKQARTDLGREGFSGSDMILERLVDMRYMGQSYELSLPINAGTLNKASLATLVNDFHREHRRIYGHASDKEPVEQVNLRLVAWGHLPRFATSDHKDSHDDPAKPFEQRTVWFNKQMFDSNIFNRDDLSTEQLVKGPAIIEQLDSTTVIPPGFTAVLEPQGNLIIEQESL